MTRAAPRQLYGFEDRGSLGAGSVADVAVYKNNERDRAEMFRHAAYVFKDGELVVRNGDVARYTRGRTLHVKPDYNRTINKRLDSYYGRSLWPAAWHVRGRGRGAAGRSGFRGGSMPQLVRKGVRIDDSFAEAFPMSGTGLVITAPNRKWAMIAAHTMTGFATSVIGCGCEAGVDTELSAKETLTGVRACESCFSRCPRRTRRSNSSTALANAC